MGHRMIIPNSIKLQVITDYILGLLIKIMKNISENQYMNFRKAENEKNQIYFYSVCLLKKAPEQQENFRRSDLFFMRH